MTGKYSLEQIKAFWETQANEHGASHAASWTDLRVMEMEIAEIIRCIEDGDSVLDVGCANGFSTVQFAAQRRISIRGVDYIPEMIRAAQSRLAKLPALSDSVDFRVGDVTALEGPDAVYDKVITIRVLINLATWERQKQGIMECTRLLKPGGLLLLSEATEEGLDRLNRFRREWGLPDLPQPPFNCYLNQARLCEETAQQLDLIEVRDFASTYYVGTRVLKPIIAQLLGREGAIPDPAMEWNRWFSQLPACGDYGTQKLIVFRKRRD